MTNKHRRLFTFEDGQNFATLWINGQITREQLKEEAKKIHSPEWEEGFGSVAKFGISYLVSVL